MTKDFDTDINIQPTFEAAQQTINFFSKQAIYGNNNVQLSGVINLFVNGADEVVEQIKYVSGQQAFTLYQLIEQIADYEYRTKSLPKSYFEIWNIFKRKFSLTEYAYLPASQFNEALSFLKSHLGTHGNV